MLKRLLVFMFASAIFLLISVTPALAYYGEPKDLLTWAQYFSRDYDKVDEYHFALNYVEWEDAATGEVVAENVPHLDGTVVTYAIEDTSGWPDPDARDTTVLSAALDMWGGRVSMEETSINEAVIYITYVNAHATNPDVITSVSNYRCNLANGVLRSDLDEELTTTITLYNIWFTNYSTEDRGKIFAHELGHVLGLADVYSSATASSITQDRPATYDALMGDGRFDVLSAGTPDLVTTYGVRDGSAGPDYLGITNTNFDFPTG
ncbi:MAG: hypothetical protein LBU07_04620 [Coriobacteriales bacterium]|jgi:hypothetical protein|nr:hypothetical protein [Coriobacteriales bacterium]